MRIATLVAAAAACLALSACNSEADKAAETQADAIEAQGEAAADATEAQADAAATPAAAEALDQKADATEAAANAAANKVEQDAGKTDDLRFRETKGRGVPPPGLFLWPATPHTALADDV